MTLARAAARLAATDAARMRTQTRCRAGFVVALCANGASPSLTASAR